jgi:ribonucleoside-diphosphate reductase alpha chain
MIIVKRNGKEEELNYSKLKKVIDYACEGLENCDPLELEHALIGEFRNGITTREIQEALVKTAIEKTSIEQPNWQFVAARLYLYDAYKEAGLSRKYKKFGYSDFFKLVHCLTKQDVYGDYLLQHYSKEEVEELGEYIKPERDFLFNYVGVKQLMDRYTAKSNKAEIMELPQERFMIVAMHLAMKEKHRIHWAKRFYDVLSQLKATVATPTLANAGKVFHQLSSCFIDTVDDNLWSIYNTNDAFAHVSKFGGGMGIAITKVRAKNSPIRGVAGASGGIVPWIKNFNNTALACNQLGVRQGSVAIYLDVWHKDVLDFLQLKTNAGDDRMKAHDIFPAVNLPDNFMRAVENRENYYLFCPHEVETYFSARLEDTYGEEFEDFYKKCVDHPMLPRVEIPAIDIMKRIMQSAFETGTPFIMFKDTVNRMNPNKHAGMIYSSNLCTEILQNGSPSRLVEERIEGNQIIRQVENGDYITCNLASINLGRVESDEDLENTTTTLMRSMDNVIDLNFYPVKQSEITNQKYRAIGLGVSGYHQDLAQKGISWESEQHLEYADELFENINYYAIKASMENAKEKGSYELFEGSEWQRGEYFIRRKYSSLRWKKLREEVQKHGVRNSYMFAIAPTGSTSLISGSTAGIDPVFSKFWMEEKKNGLIPQTAPNLNLKTFWFYKEAHNIDQVWSIRAAGIRQRHIDQGQSFNLYIRPTISAKEMLNLYLTAWKVGMKTLYYVRSQSLEVEDCVSCSS